MLPLLLCLTVPLQTVTADIHAMRSSEFLKKLSSIAQVRLEATPRTEKDVVCMHIEGAPLSQVLERIAEAQGASWQPIEGGYRLVRSSADELREARAELASRSEAFRRGQEELRATSAKHEETLEVTAAKIRAVSKQLSNDPFSAYPSTKAQELRPGLPLTQSLSKIALSIAPEDLAKIPLDQDQFYSNQPLKGEARFPSNWRGLLSDGISQEDKSVGSLRGIISKVTTSNATRGIPLLEPYERGETTPKDARILLRITRNPGIGGRVGHVSFFLQIAAADGRPYTSEDCYIREFDEEPEAKEDKPVFPVSDDVVSFSSSIRAFRSGPIPDSGTIQQLLQDPEHVDPLDIVAGPMLLAMARVRHENMVACIPDQAFTTVLASSDKQGVPSFLARLRHSAMMSVKESDGWLAFGPNEAEFTRRTRVDRSSLARLIQTSFALGAVSLDSVSAFLLQYPKLKINQNELPNATIGCLMSSPGFSQSTYDWIRWHGLLNSGQVRILDGGETLDLDGLSSTQFAGLESALRSNARSIFPIVDGRPMMKAGSFDIPRFADEVFEGLPREGSIRRVRTAEGAPFLGNECMVQQSTVSYQVRFVPSWVSKARLIDFTRRP